MALSEPASVHGRRPCLQVENMGILQAPWTSIARFVSLEGILTARPPHVAAYHTEGRQSASSKGVYSYSVGIRVDCGATVVKTDGRGTVHTSALDDVDNPSMTPLRGPF